MLNDLEQRKVRLHLNRECYVMLANSYAKVVYDLDQAILELDREIHRINETNKYIEEQKSQLRLALHDFIDEKAERKYWWYRKFLNGALMRFIKEPVYLYNGGWDD